MAGVYVHLPFCPYICPYCDFAKWPHKRSAAARYLAALYAEIDSAARDWGQRQYSSVFLGGGTPNTYAAGDIAALVDRLRRAFPGPRDRETNIELNPELVGLGGLGRPSIPQDDTAVDRDDAAARYDSAVRELRVYRDAGVNRISVGVQSFVREEIAAMGRRHTAGDVERVVRAAREAGVRSVSIDLIFAVPGQTAQSWRHSLQTAIDLGVDHISTYGLTIEAGTPYERWHAREPGVFAGEDLEAALYETAIELLEAHGFEHYEISNFARPGHRSGHNASYWENGEYAGLGVGAASYRDGVRSVHTRELEAYIAAAQAGQGIPGESERLEGARRAGEAVMLALRTAQGVCLSAFKERYGLDFLDFYAPVVGQYRSLGLLETDATHARLTKRGRFVANDVCAAFVTFA